MHPVIDWTYVVGQPVLGGELSFDLECGRTVAQQWRRHVCDQQADREDHPDRRVSTDANWRRRLTDNIGITYTPFANLRGDLYSVHDAIDPETGAVISNDTGVRGVATGGVLVAYPWLARTASASHVVEPIGQIIARTASVKQRSLPDEDAKSIVFDDTNLFELDKTTGWDRMETGTRAQRRPAVHLPGEQRRHGARPRRSKLPAGRRQHIPEPRHAVRSGHLCDAARHIQCQQRPRDVAFRLCAGHVPGAFVGVPPDRPGTLRRE